MSSAASSPSPARRLPCELWDAILLFVPPSQLQATALALLAVLPQSRVSVANLFRHITISNDRQLKALLARLSLDGLALVHKDLDTLHHHHPIDISAIPRSFALRSWRLVDNNILINIINILASNLRVIDLFIGPMFGPDQLEDLFLKPKSKLELLSLRFNQNVSRRSYEPFLKGAYFDSCCDLLAKWPASASFRSLSFVQDLPPPYQKSGLLNDGIAQPIILFRFWCITALAASPIGRHLRHLRLRIPARNLGVPLTNSAANPQPIPVGSAGAEFRVPGALFPSLEFLDLSTSFLLSVSSVSSGLAAIFKRYPSLQHLVLDRTCLIVPCRFEGDEERVLETVRAIGSAAAAAGVSRAIEVGRLWRDLHKLIETEIAQARRRANGFEDHTRQDSMHGASGAELGRQKPKRRGRSAYASAPRARVSGATAAPVASSSAHPEGPRTDVVPLEQQDLPAKLVILPSPSSLLSICCGTELPRDSAQGTRAEWQQAFEAGWAAGLRRHEEAVEERLGEYGRSMDGWRKAVAQQAGDEEALERVLCSRPRLVQQVGGQRRARAGLDGCVGRFMEAMGLAETEPDKVHAELALYKTRTPPAFCTVPDCAAVGKVAWVPPVPVPLLRDKESRSEEESLRAKMDKVHLDEQENLVDGGKMGGGKWDQSRDCEQQEVEDHDDGLHVEKCGHLVGRKIWSEENW